jgi:hypothetical protein
MFVHKYHTVQKSYISHCSEIPDISYTMYNCAFSVTLCTKTVFIYLLMQSDFLQQTIKMACKSELSISNSG